MSRLFRLGLVLGLYALAFVLTSVVFEILQTEDARNDQGGMQAFGDLLFLGGLFCIFSLVPTTLALWFLRAWPKFWAIFAGAALAFAATGPVAAIMAWRLSSPEWADVGFLGLMRLLGSPLLCIGFLVCAAIAPGPRPRRLLLAAAGVEVVVDAYSFFCIAVVGHWL